MCVSCKFLENPIDKMQKFVEVQQVALELNNIDSYRKYEIESQWIFEEALKYKFEEAIYCFCLDNKS